MRHEGRLKITQRTWKCEISDLKCQQSKLHYSVRGTRVHTSILLLSLVLADVLPPSIEIMDPLEVSAF